MQPTYLKRMMVFIDGENLLHRFQDMIAAGAVPDDSRLLSHSPDIFVWHDRTVRGWFYEIIRVTYYTTAYGDEPKLRGLAEQIKQLRFDVETQGCNPEHGNLFPKVFKKANREAKSKAVDINITVDMLTHVHQATVDAVYLVAGDADYLPLIEEVMHSGKQVHLAALSSGLNPKLPTAVDSFLNLDPYYFPVDKQNKPEEN